MKPPLKKEKSKRAYRFRNYKKSIYIAIKTDIEKFIARYEEKNSCDYVDFADVWQSMIFTFIFSGERHNKLLGFLLDSAFAVAKKYITYSSDQKTALCAFYLLYGLYYMQPIENMVKIRLCIVEYKKIDELIDQMCTKGQYDAMYTFVKMRVHACFDFVVYPYPLFITSKSNAQYTENDTALANNADKLIKQIDQLLEDETLVNLNKINTEYEEKLKKYIERNPNCGLSQPEGPTLYDQLKSSYDKIKSNTNTDMEKPSSSTSCQLDIRQRIKRKAYRQVQDHFRMKNDNNSSESE